MFGLFNIPRVRYSYYRPTFYRQRYVPFESYLLRSIRQAQEYDNFRTLLYNAMIQQQKEKESQEVLNDKETQETKEEPLETDQPSNASPKPYYCIESHSIFDGEKIVEERKTQQIDSEGRHHRSIKRRLGDQWYESEEIKDCEGKVSVKESWHNVSEEEIDKFKEEWISKSGYKPELTENKEEEKIEKGEEKEKLSEPEEINNEAENNLTQPKEIDNQGENAAQNETDLKETKNESENEEKSQNQEKSQNVSNLEVQSN